MACKYKPKDEKFTAKTKINRTWQAVKPTKPNVDIKSYVKKATKK